MSILNANGSIACAKCGEDARAERDQLKVENAKLRELLQRLLTEYRYMRSRPRRVYLQHEGRMRAIEEEMCELGIEVPE